MEARALAGVGMNIPCSVPSLQTAKVSRKMHVCELVELGAWVATRGRDFVRDATPSGRRSMEQYWLACRCRHDRWSQVLKRHERLVSLGQQTGCARVQGTMEDVLASELLTRTWAAVGCSFDLEHKRTDFEPIVRRVLVDHMEARHRVFQGLLHEEGQSVLDTARLNKLRRQTERWTDMMLGHLACDFDVAEFAFDPDRVCEFSNDLHDERQLTGNAATWDLILASLRSAYRRFSRTPSPHPELNQSIATSILACFDAGPRNLVGMSELHWMLRLSRVTENAQRLLEHLLHGEDAVERFPEFF